MRRIHGVIYSYSRGLHNLRTVHRHEGHGVRRRLSRGLHPPAQGRTAIRDRRAALHPSRRMHRLRRVRAGLSRGGDFCARRNAGEVEELHSRQFPVLSEIDVWPETQKPEGPKPDAEKSKSMRTSAVLLAITCLMGVPAAQAPPSAT